MMAVVALTPQLIFSVLLPSVTTRFVVKGSAAALRTQLMRKWLLRLWLYIGAA